MSDLVATNIRIPRDDYEWYKTIASERGESFAQLTRRVLAEKVKYPAIKSKKKSKKRSLWDIGKYAIKGGDPKASQTIDEVVYGSPHGI